MNKIRRNLDIFMAVFAGLGATALVLAHLNGDLLGILIGLLLVFVAPGYIISVALFPESTWSFMERTILTMGLSLAVSVLGGIILYAMKIPLLAETWALFYGSIILVMGAIAIIRRLIKEYPARRKSDRAPESHTHLMPRPGQLALFGLAVLIFLSAMVLAQNVARVYPDTEIVQLWMLPGESSAGPSVRIGAMVNGSAPEEYSLWLERGGYTVQTWPHLTFEPDKRWEITVQVNPNMPGTGPIEAFLYRYDQPTIPYRHVTLWMDQLEKK